MNQFSWLVGSRFAAYAFWCFVYYICIIFIIITILRYGIRIYNNVTETFLQLPVCKFKVFVIKKSKHIRWLPIDINTGAAFYAFINYQLIFLYACTYLQIITKII